MTTARVVLQRDSKSTYLFQIKVPVRIEREQEAGAVHADEHQRDENAQASDRRRRGPTGGLEKDRGHDERNRGEQEGGALREDAGLVEGLFFARQAAGKHREAQNEKQIADDRAGDRGLHHFDQPGLEREDADDELGRVAEGRIEKPADDGRRSRRQFLGGLADEPCQRHDGQRRKEKDRDRRDAGKGGADRDWHEGEEREEQIVRCVSQATYPRSIPSAASLSGTNSARPPHQRGENR